jgi:hypothetical protein
MPNHGTRPGSANGFFPLRSGDHHRREDRWGITGAGYGQVWFPWGVPYWDEDGYFWGDSYYQEQPQEQPQQPPASPQVVVVQDREPHQPAPPPASPKFIEVPDSKETPVAAKPAPPALFVLKDGEKLESRNYLLTARSLQVEVGGERREIPLDSLNLDATIAANHARGIELNVPRDRSAVFVSF